MELLNKELVAKTLYAQYIGEKNMYWLMSKQFRMAYDKGQFEEARSIKKETDALYAKMQAIEETRVHLGITDHMWETVSLAF